MADGDDKGRAKVPAIYHTVDDREGGCMRSRRDKNLISVEVKWQQGPSTINWDRLEDRCTGILQ